MAVGDVALGSSGLGFASRSSSARPPAGRGVVGAGAIEILFVHLPSVGEPHGAGEKTVRYRRVEQALPRRLSNRSTFRGLRN